MLFIEPDIDCFRLELRKVSLPDEVLALTPPPPGSAPTATAAATSRVGSSNESGPQLPLIAYLGAHQRSPSSKHEEEEGKGQQQDHPYAHITMEERADVVQRALLSALQSRFPYEFKETLENVYLLAITHSAPPSFAAQPLTIEEIAELTTHHQFLPAELRYRTHPSHLNYILDPLVVVEEPPPPPHSATSAADPARASTNNNNNNGSGKDDPRCSSKTEISAQGVGSKRLRLLPKFFDSYYLLARDFTPEQQQLYRHRHLSDGDQHVSTQSSSAAASAAPPFGKWQSYPQANSSTISDFCVTGASTRAGTGVGQGMTGFTAMEGTFTHYVLATDSSEKRIEQSSDTGDSVTRSKPREGESCTFRMNDAPTEANQNVDAADHKTGLSVDTEQKSGQQQRSCDTNKKPGKTGPTAREAARSLHFCVYRLPLGRFSPEEQQFYTYQREQLRFRQALAAESGCQGGSSGDDGLFAKWVRKGRMNWQGMDSIDEDGAGEGGTFADADAAFNELLAEMPARHKREMDEASHKFFTKCNHILTNYVLDRTLPHLTAAEEEETTAAAKAATDGTPTTTSEASKAAPKEEDTLQTAARSATAAVSAPTKKSFSVEEEQEDTISPSSFSPLPSSAPTHAQTQNLSAAIVINVGSDADGSSAVAAAEAPVEKKKKVPPARLLARLQSKLPCAPMPAAAATRASNEPNRGVATTTTSLPPPSTATAAVRGIPSAGATTTNNNNTIYTDCQEEGKHDTSATAAERATRERIINEAKRSIEAEQKQREALEYRPRSFPGVSFYGVTRLLYSLVPCDCYHMVMHDANPLYHAKSVHATYRPHTVSLGLISDLSTIPNPQRDSEMVKPNVGASGENRPCSTRATGAQREGPTSREEEVFSRATSRPTELSKGRRASQCLNREHSPLPDASNTVLMFPEEGDVVAGVYAPSRAGPRISAASPWCTGGRVRASDGLVMSNGASRAPSPDPAPRLSRHLRESRKSGKASTDENAFRGSGKDSRATTAPTTRASRAGISSKGPSFNQLSSTTDGFLLVSTALYCNNISGNPKHAMNTLAEKGVTLPDFMKRDNSNAFDSAVQSHVRDATAVGGNAKSAVVNLFQALATSSLAQHKLRFGSIRPIVSVAVLDGSDDVLFGGPGEGTNNGAARSRCSATAGASAQSSEYYCCRALMDHTWFSLPVQRTPHEQEAIQWMPVILGSTDCVSDVGCRSAVHLGLFPTAEAASGKSKLQKGIGDGDEPPSLRPKAALSGVLPTRESVMQSLDPNQFYAANPSTAAATTKMNLVDPLSEKHVNTHEREETVAADKKRGGGGDTAGAMVFDFTDSGNQNTSSSTAAAATSSRETRGGVATTFNVSPRSPPSASGARRTATPRGREGSPIPASARGFFSGTTLGRPGTTTKSSLQPTTTGTALNWDDVPVGGRRATQLPPAATPTARRAWDETPVGGSSQVRARNAWDEVPVGPSNRQAFGWSEMPATAPNGRPLPVPTTTVSNWDNMSARGATRAAPPPVCTPTTWDEVPVGGAKKAINWDDVPLRRPERIDHDEGTSQLWGKNAQDTFRSRGVSPFTRPSDHFGHLGHSPGPGRPTCNPFDSAAASRGTTMMMSTGGGGMRAPDAMPPSSQFTTANRGTVGPFNWMAPTSQTQQQQQIPTTTAATGLLSSPDPYLRGSFRNPFSPYVRGSQLCSSTDPFNASNPHVYGHQLQPSSYTGPAGNTSATGIAPFGRPTNNFIPATREARFSHDALNSTLSAMSSQSDGPWPTAAAGDTTSQAFGRAPNMRRDSRGTATFVPFTPPRNNNNNNNNGDRGRATPPPSGRTETGYYGYASIATTAAVARNPFTSTIGINTSGSSHAYCANSGGISSPSFCINEYDDVPIQTDSRVRGRGTCAMDSVWSRPVREMTTAENSRARAWTLANEQRSRNGFGDTRAPWADSDRARPAGVLPDSSVLYGGSRDTVGRSVSTSNRRYASQQFVPAASKPPLAPPLSSSVQRGTSSFKRTPSTKQMATRMATSSLTMREHAMAARQERARREKIHAYEQGLRDNYMMGNDTKRVRWDDVPCCSAAARSGAVKATAVLGCEVPVEVLVPGSGAGAGNGGRLPPSLPSDGGRVAFSSGGCDPNDGNTNGNSGAGGAGNPQKWGTVLSAAQRQLEEDIQLRSLGAGTRGSKTAEELAQEKLLDAERLRRYAKEKKALDGMADATNQQVADGVNVSFTLRDIANAFLLMPNGAPEEQDICRGAWHGEGVSYFISCKPRRLTGGWESYLERLNLYQEPFYLRDRAFIFVLRVPHLPQLRVCVAVHNVCDLISLLRSRPIAKLLPTQDEQWLRERNFAREVDESDDEESDLETKGMGVGTETIVQTSWFGGLFKTTRRVQVSSRSSAPTDITPEEDADRKRRAKCQKIRRQFQREGLTLTWRHRLALIRAQLGASMQSIALDNSSNTAAAAATSPLLTDPAAFKARMAFLSDRIAAYAAVRHRINTLKALRHAYVARRAEELAKERVAKICDRMQGQRHVVLGGDDSGAAPPRPCSTGNSCASSTTTRSTAFSIQPRQTRASVLAAQRSAMRRSSFQSPANISSSAMTLTPEQRRAGGGVAMTFDTGSSGRAGTSTHRRPLFHVDRVGDGGGASRPLTPFQKRKQMLAEYHKRQEDEAARATAAAEGPTSIAPYASGVSIVPSTATGRGTLTRGPNSNAIDRASDRLDLVLHVQKDDTLALALARIENNRKDAVAAPLTTVLRLVPRGAQPTLGVGALSPLSAFATQQQQSTLYAGFLPSPVEVHRQLEHYNISVSQLQQLLQWQWEHYQHSYEVVPIPVFRGTIVPSTSHFFGKGGDGAGEGDTWQGTQQLGVSSLARALLLNLSQWSWLLPIDYDACRHSKRVILQSRDVSDVLYLRLRRWRLLHWLLGLTIFSCYPSMCALLAVVLAACYFAYMAVCDLTGLHRRSPRPRSRQLSGCLFSPNENSMPLIDDRVSIVYRQAEWATMSWLERRFDFPTQIQMTRVMQLQSLLCALWSRLTLFVKGYSPLLSLHAVVLCLAYGALFIAYVLAMDWMQDHNMWSALRVGVANPELWRNVWDPRPRDTQRRSGGGVMDAAQYVRAALLKQQHLYAVVKTESGEGDDSVTTGIAKWLAHLVSLFTGDASTSATRDEQEAGIHRYYQNGHYYTYSTTGSGTTWASAEEPRRHYEAAQPQDSGISTLLDSLNEIMVFLAQHSGAEAVGRGRSSPGWGNHSLLVFLWVAYVVTCVMPFSPLRWLWRRAFVILLHDDALVRRPVLTF